MFADSEHAAARGLYADNQPPTARSVRPGAIFLTGGRRAARRGNPQLRGKSQPTFFAQLTPTKSLTSWRSASMAHAHGTRLAIDFTFTEPDVNYRLTRQRRVDTSQSFRRSGDGERDGDGWATRFGWLPALCDISSPGFEASATDARHSDAVLELIRPSTS